MRKYRSVAAAVVVGCVGAAVADVGPIPAATPITGTTMCVVDGWEYAPRWSMPDNGFISPSLEDCAMQCSADPICTGATYITNNDGKNCWFKDWGTGPVAPPCLPPPKTLMYQAIIDPAGVDCGAITYMEGTVYGCDEESEIDEKPDALGPAAAGAAAAPTVAPTVTDTAALTPLGFTGYAGVDYSPVQTPPPAVGIVDVGGGAGLVVADAAECASSCTAEPLCNSASYYGDNPMADWPGGDNCYLKTLTGCALPDDVVTTGDATIFMIGGTECSGAPVSALPPTGDVPLPAAPPLDVDVMTPLAAVAPTADIAPVGTSLGFDPDPTGIPPLGSTDGVGTDGADGTDRSFAAAPTGTGPPAGSEAGAGSSVPPTVAPPTAGAVGMLPGLAAVAVLGAVMLL